MGARGGSRPTNRYRNRFLPKRQNIAKIPKPPLAARDRSASVFELTVSARDATLVCSLLDTCTARRLVCSRARRWLSRCQFEVAGPGVQSLVTHACEVAWLADLGVKVQLASWACRAHACAGRGSMVCMSYLIGNDRLHGAGTG